MEKAKQVYELVCRTLDNLDWIYTRRDDDLVITTGSRGEDLPIDLIICVAPKSQTVSVLSPMPYKIEEDKRVDAAVAVCISNYGNINGTFDYDITDGEIRFRIVNSYRNCTLSEELIVYLIMLACSIVDQYNDRFLAISKGMMTIEQFITLEQEENQ